MEFAIDLNPRQSARTLDQAVRYQATVLLEPSLWPDTDGLKGRLVGVNSEALRVEITEPPMLRLDTIVASYCDTLLLLGQDRFLFSTHLVNAEQCNEQWTVDLARPAKLQVCQRRRFWRVKLAESSRVQLRLGENAAAKAVTGWLCNISGEGLACLVEAKGAEDLLIGETISAAFELPNCDKPFELDAVLCNKTPTAQQDKVIVGMQFIEPASAATAGPAHRLNEFLLHRYGSGIASNGGDARVTDGVVS